MKFRQSLFWDTDPARLNLAKHARYIIERVLDFGNEEEIRWLARQYPAQLIQNVISRSRVLHAKSKALWSRVFR